ncbi:MAG: hypothetical protein LBH51_07730 [Treponema sp.]|jgi:hypothetical protein|nr:hypothetical protein [Treponema sp.]
MTIMVLFDWFFGRKGGADDVLMEDREFAGLFEYEEEEDEDAEDSFVISGRESLSPPSETRSLRSSSADVCVGGGGGGSPQIFGVVPEIQSWTPAVKNCGVGRF